MGILILGNCLWVKAEGSKTARVHYINGIEIDSRYSYSSADEIISMPEIGVEFIWKKKYRELYVLKLIETDVTELMSNGTMLVRKQKIMALSKVYGVTQMMWDDEPETLAVSKKGTYKAVVMSFDDHVELNVMLNETVIFTRTWFAVMD